MAASHRADALASEAENGELTADVYEELRRLAAARMSRESVGHTLQPTALVHEAWLRLEGGGPRRWRDQGHFIATAARAMRHILVDHARRKAAAKRQRESGDEAEEAGTGHDDHLVVIHDALTRLEAEDAAAARIVLLKFFAGLGSMEIARMDGVGVRTVERQWTLAKARLFQLIHEEGYGPAPGLT